ncbi:unnamed protein product [Trichobilharzia szidati]|nr:unnamed protein product [Trichobilharzia szidati]
MNYPQTDKPSPFKKISNSLRNSPTFSTHSAPFLNQLTDQGVTLKSSSGVCESNHASFSMANVKEVLERLKNEVEVERTRRTMIARQRSQDIYKLTTRSKAENRILLSALKHAENKAKMYRDEYHKLKSKVQGKFSNSGQENVKLTNGHNEIHNNDQYQSRKESIKTQSDWTINRKVSTSNPFLLTYALQMV